jgi:hypothetical protein
LKKSYKAEEISRVTLEKQLHIMYRTQVSIYIG